MSTHSRIGILRADGSVISIYCHSDGYPEYTGKILYKHYTDEVKIQELMDLGDLSVLGPEIGVKHDFMKYDQSMCRAYGRDRGEENTDALVHPTLNDFLDNAEDFNYVWDAGRWRCFSYDRKEVSLKF